MGRGQSKSRATAANRKAGGQKRSMKAAVTRAQKGLESRAGYAAKRQARRDAIQRNEFQNRQAN